MPAGGMMGGGPVLGRVELAGGSGDLEHSPIPQLPAGMSAEQRIDLYHEYLESLFANSEQFLIFQAAGDQDAYVQYRFSETGLYGEVGSRQWGTVGFAPTMTSGVTEALLALGFTGGGPGSNFGRDGIEADAAAVAELTENLFHAAYRLPADFAVSGQLGSGGAAAQHGADIQTLNDELIQQYLDHYELGFTRGDSGTFDVPRSYEPCLGRGLLVQLARRGEEGTVLEMLVSPDRTTPHPRWSDMLDACNEWNMVKRWPKVYLREVAPEHGERQALIHCEASIALGAGVHWPLLKDWLDEMIGTTWDFWRWMTAERGL